MKVATKFLVTLVTVATTTAFAAAGWAYWSTNGSGTASAAGRALAPPINVNVPTWSSGSVFVQWTASSMTSPNVAPAGYYVQRFSGTTASAACGSSPSSLVTATTCTDAGVSQGTYTYKVTAVLHSWSARSGTSNAVTVDTTAPVTTDNATSAWTRSAQVTLTPVDTGGSGISSTYYTTDGTTPTTSSHQGTSIVLSTQGVYTIKYFSVDAAGNSEAVKTAVNQVRIDTTPPVGGAVTVNAVAATVAGSTSSTASTAFTITGRTNYTEAASGTASGLASSVLTVQSATLTDTTCGTAGSGGPYPVATTITNTTNPSITAGFCYIYTLTGTDNAGNTTSVRTTVRVNPPPTISSPTTASPALVANKAPSVTVTITGTGFQSGASVTLTDNGGFSLKSFTIVSATQITIVVDAPSAANKVNNIVVTNPDGASVTVNGGLKST
jgi:hypothetical protein